MKVLIIEDEAPAFRRLQKILEEVDSTIEIVEVIDTVEDSVRWLRNHTAPELIFMDIQLSDGISFEIFEQAKITSPVIFTTAFDEYMLRAFKVNSIDYLLKPIKKDDLAHSLRKYAGMKETFSANGSGDLNELIRNIHLSDRKYKTRFLVKKGEQLLSVQSDDIAFFFARNGIIHLQTREGKVYLVDFTLDELEKQLDPDYFYRANRQFILHFSAIKTVHKWYKSKLLIEPLQSVDEKIIVSAERASAFKQWLGDK